jgi:ABC-type molybdate transport system permease subunit
MVMCIVKLDLSSITMIVLPSTVVNFLLLLLWDKNGFIGQILDFFGVTVIFYEYAIVIASTVVAFPLMYKKTRTLLKNVLFLSIVNNHIAKTINGVTI